MKGQRRVSLALALGLHAVALASLIKRSSAPIATPAPAWDAAPSPLGLQTEQTIVPALACQKSIS